MAQPSSAGPSLGGVNIPASASVTSEEPLLSPNKINSVLGDFGERGVSSPGEKVAQFVVVDSEGFRSNMSVNDNSVIGVEQQYFG